MGNKIFIDAGANNGCSVRRFRSEYDKDCEFSIYSFEVEPKFYEEFKDIDKHIFINKAVWVSDGFMDFYRSDSKYIDGGTLIKSKISGNLDKKHPIKVETINFSEWVLRTFLKEDYIILKMDIEGAEYSVLEKMLEDNSIDYIDELWIEWHRKKTKVSLDRHNNLISKIKIPIKEWDALKW